MNAEWCPAIPLTFTRRPQQRSRQPHVLYTACTFKSPHPYARARVRTCVCVCARMLTAMTPPKTCLYVMCAWHSRHSKWPADQLSSLSNCRFRQRYNVTFNFGRVHAQRTLAELHVFYGCKMECSLVCLTPHIMSMWPTFVLMTAMWSGQCIQSACTLRRILEPSPPVDDTNYNGHKAQGISGSAAVGDTNPSNSSALHGMTTLQLLSPTACPLLENRCLQQQHSS